MKVQQPNPTQTWDGLRSAARGERETRVYTPAGALAEQLARIGVSAATALAGRAELADAWIPGVEIFPRRVFQQKGRGYFAELTRLSDGVLEKIGLRPQQWASALMHRDSAKGFHIHPPYVPPGEDPALWFARMFDCEGNYAQRHYEREQWDVMFFLTSLCEMLLVDERAGLPRRVMRLLIAGDSRPGPDNVAVVIPPGVAHALRNLGCEDLVMVYGTSTVFNPEWEGRIASEVEQSPLPAGWERYLRMPG